LNSGFQLNHLHDFFNIYFDPPKYQIMEQTTHIKYIRHNCYMRVFFLWKLFESLFQDSKCIFNYWPPP
jgi:hypothetical protein